MPAKELKLSTESRVKIGTTGANALRHAGKIPVVLYGHGAAPEHAAVDAHAFEELLHRSGRNAIITLSGGAKSGETALVRAVQYHPVSRRVLHADLQRVSARETITATLPVITAGVPRGIRDSGGVMDVVTHQLEIEGPAGSIPEHIEVDVSELGLHEHFTAGDVDVARGFHNGHACRCDRRFDRAVAHGTRTRRGSGRSCRSRRTRSHRRDAFLSDGAIVSGRSRGAARRRPGQPRTRVCRNAAQRRLHGSR